MKASSSALAAKSTAVISDPFLLCTLCSPDGRAFPDISAQALNYPFIINDDKHYMNGSICSASVRLSLFPSASSPSRPFSGTQLTDRERPDSGGHNLAG